MQINRLFEIVYILLNKKLITANELAAHFEVSKRTILRDIETFSIAGTASHYDWSMKKFKTHQNI